MEVANRDIVKRQKENNIRGIRIIKTEKPAMKTIQTLSKSQIAQAQLTTGGFALLVTTTAPVSALSAATAIAAITVLLALMGWLQAFASNGDGSNR